MNEAIRFESERVTGVWEKAAEVRWQLLLEDMPNGWSRSAGDPTALVKAFPSLSLKEGYHLRAYQYREGRDGNGVIWALPQSMPGSLSQATLFPEPEYCETFELPRQAWTLETVPSLIPPRPDGALDDVMEAMDGDKSPWSYLCASLLAREIAEFGAFGHGNFWSAFHLLFGDPFVGREEDLDYRLGHTLPGGDADDWKWLAPRPKQWLPEVRLGGGVIEVSFYTFSGLGRQIISKHLDSYKPEQYQFEENDLVTAVGPEGYVW